MANSKRIESLDIAKGFGILIVVLGHVLRPNDVFLKEFIFFISYALVFYFVRFCSQNRKCKR